MAHPPLKDTTIVDEPYILSLQELDACKEAAKEIIKTDSMEEVSEIVLEALKPPTGLPPPELNADKQEGSSTKDHVPVQDEDAHVITIPISGIYIELNPSLQDAPMPVRKQKNKKKQLQVQRTIVTRQFSRSQAK
ncbi:hypothetical protein M9H77_36184 [Catharanthus roseus]|uniref:Uncharacterized protein n=1 Tax=Catharanthus roseus TaxID=4058 RepID=A0ACB9ZR52_CATRO|nr:hypothetical protein M9H77_36184 [Catharanthus roseus]